VFIQPKRSDVPANQILQICTKTRDGERASQEWRRACGRPSTTWTHQICRDTGVTATEALQPAEDPQTLRVTMIMMTDFTGTIYTVTHNQRCSKYRRLK